MRKRPGLCAKQSVMCTIIDLLTGARYVGTNYCLNPQGQCPRKDLPSGKGYEMCREICEQPAHAEVNAAHAAMKGNRGRLTQAIAYVEGHTYSCDRCLKVLEEAGVGQVIIGAPPEE